MPKPRDYQRQKVYDAEWAMERQMRMERLLDLHDVRAWLANILTSKWFQNRWPYVIDVEVLDGRGRRSGAAKSVRFDKLLGDFGPAYMGRLKLPRLCRDKLSIMHELAHVVTDAQYFDTVAGHGPEFAGTSLLLVATWCGTAYGDLLRAQYRRHRVDFTEDQDYTWRLCKDGLKPAWQLPADLTHLYAQRLRAAIGE